MDLRHGKLRSKHVETEEFIAYERIMLFSNVREWGSHVLYVRRSIGSASAGGFWWLSLVGDLRSLSA